MIYMIYMIIYNNFHTGFLRMISSKEHSRSFYINPLTRATSQCQCTSFTCQNTINKSHPKALRQIHYNIL